MADRDFHYIYEADVEQLRQIRQRTTDPALAQTLDGILYRISPPTGLWGWALDRPPGSVDPNAAPPAAPTPSVRRRNLDL